MKWWPIGGKCPHCGRPATILEAVANQAGQIGFEMVCVTCGKELSVVFEMAEVIAKAAVLDCKQPEDPYVSMLENFQPKGPAN